MHITMQSFVDFILIWSSRRPLRSITANCKNLAIGWSLSQLSA